MSFLWKSSLLIGEGEFMLLRELAGKRLIELDCDECGSRTALDPSFFLARRNTKTTIDELQSDLVCPGCGSSEIWLSVQSAKSS